MTEAPAKTVDLIQKLLRLARDGGATEHEAERAMSKAQELMAEHNLTLAGLDASGQSDDASSARATERTDKRAMYKWQRDLMDTLATTNFCRVTVAYRSQRDRANGGTTGRSVPSGYQVIGRPSNVVALRQMFDYLLGTIERLTAEFTGGGAAERMTRSAVSFREGAAERLRERLSERHERWMAERRAKERETAAAGRHPAAAPVANALVVVMDDYVQREIDLNDDARCGYAPGTTARMRAEAAAERAVREAKRREDLARYRAEGIPSDVASWMSMGYPRAVAESLAAPPPEEKPETERERAKRREREERDSERYYQRRAREHAKTDHGARQRGRAAGDRVGLDAQVSSDPSKRLT